MLFNLRDWWWFSSWFRWSSCISELFWWLNYVFILFNNLFDTLAWNRFQFYAFPFSCSRWYNWLVCISELFWWLNYVFMLVNHLFDTLVCISELFWWLNCVFMLVNHLLNAIRWLLSSLLKKQFN